MGVVQHGGHVRWLAACERWTDAVGFPMRVRRSGVVTAWPDPVRNGGSAVQSQVVLGPLGR